MRLPLTILVDDDVDVKPLAPPAGNPNADIDMLQPNTHTVSTKTTPTTNHRFTTITQVKLSLTSSVSSQSKMPQQGSFSTWDVAITSMTCSSAFIGSACRSELYSRWRRWHIVLCMVPHHLTWHRHSQVSPTCRTDTGSGPPQLNSLTFRPVVGQLSEVVPFLLLEQRCGIACQAMLHQPRRCRCSRTGWSHICSVAATKCRLWITLLLPSHYLPSRTVVLAIVFTV